MTEPGLGMDMATDVLMMVAAWSALYMIRQGRFREAVRMYISLMLVAAVLAYAAIGLERLSNDPFPMLLLGLGGLMLGRKALWSVYGVLIWCSWWARCRTCFSNCPRVPSNGSGDARPR
jgi:hypothetical protein